MIEVDPTQMWVTIVFLLMVGFNSGYWLGKST